MSLVPSYRALSDVAERPLRWLWPGVIPLGKLTLLAGDPGLGKSMLTMDLAARATRGGPWPACPADAPRDPGSVILLSAEDDPADTIRPRLRAAGADLARVLFMDGVIDERGFDEFSIDQHMLALATLVERAPKCRLVVIDPISAYVGEIDSHNNTQVRRLLRPLARLAQQEGVAVLAVTHLSKGEREKTVYRTMGSLAFTAAARSVWLVERDPEDSTGRVLAPVKNNLSADSMSFGWRIADGRIEFEEGTRSLRADDLLRAPSAVSGPDEALPVDRAAEWLTATLGEGSLPARDVEARARAAGISQKTLARAKAQLGIVSTRAGAGFVWSFAGDAERAAGVQ